MLKLKDKLYLSWNDIERSVDELCVKIQESLLPINSVHGLARGGYIPAVMISHKLNIPYSTTILRDTLVIDDICLLYTSPSPRDRQKSRMPSSA